MECEGQAARLLQRFNEEREMEREGDNREKLEKESKRAVDSLHDVTPAIKRYNHTATWAVNKPLLIHLIQNCPFFFLSAARQASMRSPTTSGTSLLRALRTCAHADISAFIVEISLDCIWGDERGAPGVATVQSVV
jgi:hypothetical protein